MNNQTSEHILPEILNGRYKLQKTLSQKPGQQTFLANDLQTQELVVIKLLKFGSDFEWESHKLFEREAQILKTLSHPRIPKYLDYFEIDLPDCKGFALVQQYIEAQSLEAHLAGGKTFSTLEIKIIAEDCLNILIDLHQQNPPLVHRDLKPSNILLTNRSEKGLGQIYLVDFGAGQNQVALGEGTFTVVGTYGYMPPEQFGGRSVPASDLYSLGATLIYLLTKVHPANLPQKDLRIQFKQVTQLSPEFSRWLEKMIEPSLDKRFNSAQLALQALKRPGLVNYDPLAAGKPEGSRIFFTKDTEVLQILLPPSESIYVLFFGFTILTLIYTSRVTLPIDLVNAALILMFALIVEGHIFLLSPLLRSAFRQNRLQIDEDSISMRSEIFGLSFRKSPSSPRQNITKLLCITPKFLFVEEDSFYSIDCYYKYRSIILVADKQEYVLNSLTWQEQEWLAHELSDWLGIPIQHCFQPIIEKASSGDSNV